MKPAAGVTIEHVLAPYVSFSPDPGAVPFLLPAGGSETAIRNPAAASAGMPW